MESLFKPFHGLWSYWLNKIEKKIKCFGIMTNCYFCRIKCAKMCILQWKLLFNTLITQCFMRHSFFALFHLNRLFVWLVFIVFAHNVQHVNGIHDQKLNRIPNERKIKPMKYFTRDSSKISTKEPKVDASFSISMASQVECHSE